MTEHFLMKGKRSVGESVNLGSFVEEASRYVTITEVHKGEGYAFATGNGCFLLVFLQGSDVILEAYSSEGMDWEGVKALSFRLLKITGERTINLESAPKVMKECEEPNCTRHATTVYKVGTCAKIIMTIIKRRSSRRSHTTNSETPLHRCDSGATAG